MNVFDFSFWRERLRLLGFVAIIIGAGAWVTEFMGAVVAVNQNFMGWVKISKGEFAFSEQLYMDPFLLSGGALFIIIGQIWLLLTHPAARSS